MHVRSHVLDRGTPTGTRSLGRLSCAKRTPGSSTRPRIAICLRRAVAVGASAILVGIRQPAGVFTRGAQVEAAPWKMQRLQLGSRLPINLRHFLAEQLGSSMRVEDDSIVALEPRSNETLMRELARAIRRFSAERAREAWCECAMGLDRLEREFFAAPSDDRGPVVLCLRCSCVGAGPLDQHCGTRCIPVHLDAEVRAQQLEGK